MYDSWAGPQVEYWKLHEQQVFMTCDSRVKLLIERMTNRQIFIKWKFDLFCKEILFLIKSMWSYGKISLVGLRIILRHILCLSAPANIACFSPESPASIDGSDWNRSWTEPDHGCDQTGLDQY